MINIYENANPRILQHGVNGKDGFVIVPDTSDDEDNGIYFEDWPTLTAYIEALAGQIVGVDPADVQDYDDWEATR